MPSLAKHHFLRAYLPLMVPFRTRFSRREVVHVAYVQGLAGYLYTRWWSSHIPTLRFHGTPSYPRPDEMLGAQFLTGQLIKKERLVML